MESAHSLISDLPASELCGLLFQPLGLRYWHRVMSRGWKSFEALARKSCCCQERTVKSHSGECALTRQREQLALPPCSGGPEICSQPRFCHTEALSAAWSQREAWVFPLLVVKLGCSGSAPEGGEGSGNPTWHLFAAWKIEHFKQREKERDLLGERIL